MKVEGKLCTVQEALSVINNMVLCSDGKVQFCHICAKSRTVKWEPKKDEVNDSQDVPDEVKETVPKTDEQELSSTSPASEEYSEDETIDALWRNAKSSVIQVAAAVGGAISQPSDTSTGTAQKPPVHELLLQCPVCHKTETTQKACLQHISDKHPHYNFPCTSCEHVFPSYSAKYGHEKEHQLPKHYCTECGMGFLYNSKLERHAGVHNEVLPFPCKDCDKHFASKKSLVCHQQVHLAQSLKCQVCDRVFDTPERRYSHFRGTHGEGYYTFCGKNYPWPAGRAHHQSKCDTCIEIKAEKNNAKKRQLATSQVSQPLKKEEEESNETLLKTKNKISLKIEKIIDMKKDLE